MKYIIQHSGPLTWHEKQDIELRNKGNAHVERLVSVIDALPSGEKFEALQEERDRLLSSTEDVERERDEFEEEVENLQEHIRDLEQEITDLKCEVKRLNRKLKELI